MEKALPTQAVIDLFKKHTEEVLKPMLVGQNIFDIIQSRPEGLEEEYVPTAAWAGVDNCLWDIIGKAKNKPVYELIPVDGKPQTRIRIYASGGDYHEWFNRGEHTLINEALSYKAMGIEGFKFRVGSTWSESCMTLDKYLPVVRTERTVGRGNATYSSWNEEIGMKQAKILTDAGLVDADTVFERITYLLDRLLPVAEEYNVQLGNHIADPPIPEGFKGITRWNSPDIMHGIKRFANLSDSPMHGFNLCLGSCAEGMKDPNTEIYELICYAGDRNQIFNVHMRNIKGGWGNFQEVYPDNGDMDFVDVMRSLRDVQYKYMIMPDHIPKHHDDPDGSQGFAFCMDTWERS